MVTEGYVAAGDPRLRRHRPGAESPAAPKPRCGTVVHEPGSRALQSKARSESTLSEVLTVKMVGAYRCMSCRPSPALLLRRFPPVSLGQPGRLAQTSLESALLVEDAPPFTDWLSVLAYDWSVMIGS
eukprot:scaffold1318_cov388-Prasinococcus_capsulatus_cf.AAC.33